MSSKSRWIRRRLNEDGLEVATAVVLDPNPDGTLTVDIAQVERFLAEAGYLPWDGKTS